MTGEQMSKSKQKLRACPAVGREISSAECGENRASRYGCPASCPFNPWSPENYDRALATEDSLVKKLMARLAVEARANPGIRSEVDDALYAGADLVGRQQFFVHKFHRERDAEGLTLAGRLLKSKFGELNNDERFLISRMENMRPALVEIHRVLDDAECEAVDLLDPKSGSFLIHDRSLASQAVRFSHLLIWLFEMPHYRRTHGAGLNMVEAGDMDPVEVLVETVAHLGGPRATGGALPEWLDKNMDQMHKAFAAINAAMKRRLFESIDAKFCRATYRLRANTVKIFNKLDGYADSEPGELSDKDSGEGFVKVYDWFDEPSKEPADQASLPLEPRCATKIGRPLLGAICVAPDRIRIEASSSARYQALRARFEKRLGSFVEFESERVDDPLAGRLKEMSAKETALVPPFILEHAPRIITGVASIKAEIPAGLSGEEANEFMNRQHHEKWLDERIPAFNNLTPRAAAADSAMRPKLVGMLKSTIREHDMRNLRTGGMSDINWLVRELGLNEVLFEAPPWREPQADDEDGDEEGEEEKMVNDGDGIDSGKYDIPPPLPPGPLGISEISERMADMLDCFSDVMDAMSEFADVAPQALDFFVELTAKLNDKWADGALIHGVLKAWFIFFPLGTRPSKFNLENLAARVGAELEKAEDLQDEGADAVLNHLKSGTQPVLTGILASEILDLATKGSKKERMNPNFAPLLLLILKGFIDELDSAAR
jgi:hypothetical protein